MIAFVLGDETVINEYYICEAGDPSFLGTYTKSTVTMDGVSVYTNANDRSFFRNKSFWYLGNLGPWPPETHYRCVEPEGCNPAEEIPPTSTQGVWSVAKKFGKEPLPVITTTPCPAGTDEL